MKKKIIFVCATGIATSTAVAEKVIAYLKSRDIEIDYTQMNVAATANLDSSAGDLIVATTNIPYDIDIPSIRGLSFMTGIGEEETLEEIYEAITKE